MSRLRGWSREGDRAVSLVRHVGRRVHRPPEGHRLHLPAAVRGAQVREAGGVVNDVKITDGGLGWLNAERAGFPTVPIPAWAAAALEAHYRAKFAAEQHQWGYDGTNDVCRIHGEPHYREAAIDTVAAEQPATPTRASSPEDIAAEYAPFDGSDPDTVIYMRGIIATAIRQDRLSAATPTPSTEQVRAEVIDWFDNNWADATPDAARLHFAALVVQSRDITESHSSDTPNTEQIKALAEALAVERYGERNARIVRRDDPHLWGLSMEHDFMPRAKRYLEAALVSPVSEQPTTGFPVDGAPMGGHPSDVTREQPTPLDSEPDDFTTADNEQWARDHMYDEQGDE